MPLRAAVNIMHVVEDHARLAEVRAAYRLAPVADSAESRRELGGQLLSGSRRWSEEALQRHMARAEQKRKREEKAKGSTSSSSDL